MHPGNRSFGQSLETVGCCIYRSKHVILGLAGNVPVGSVHYIDEVKVIWKIGWCYYSLKIVKAAMRIASQIILAAARQSRRCCSFKRCCLNGVYLTENNISQSCCQHLLKDLEVRVLIFVVTIITKPDPDGQRPLNTFLMLPRPPGT